MPILVEETVFFVSVGSQNTCWIRPAFWFIWLSKWLRKFQAVQLSSLLIKKTINSIILYLPQFSFHFIVRCSYVPNPFGGAWPPWYPQNPWPNPWPKPPHPPPTIWMAEAWHKAPSMPRESSTSVTAPAHRDPEKPWHHGESSPIPPDRAALPGLPCRFHRPWAHPWQSSSLARELQECRPQEARLHGKRTRPGWLGVVCWLDSLSVKWV